MTLDSIKSALKQGSTVCYKTSRYEVIKHVGGILARDLYDGSTIHITSSEAQQCFIKTGGV